jgi:hypothetical protein
MTCFNMIPAVIFVANTVYRRAKIKCSLGAGKRV